MKHVSLALALCLGATTTFAADFRSMTGLKVRSLGSNTYEVFGVPTWGSADYWCSIGEYAQRILKVDPGSRIYVVGDRKRGQQGYIFSTSPVGTASEASRVRSTTLGVDGANRRANAARAECNGRRNVGR